MFDGCVYDVLKGARCLSTPRQCFTSAYWPAITHGERIVSCTKTAANNVRPIIEGPSNLSQLKIGLPRPTKTQKNEIIFHVSDQLLIFITRDSVNLLYPVSQFRVSAFQLIAL